VLPIWQKFWRITRPALIANSLGLGAPDTNRAMHAVSLSELTALSQQFCLRLLHANDSEDRLGHTSKWCRAVVLELPDDSLGTLPLLLLRHLLLVHEKSSIYKMALLRIPARVAGSANGCARHEVDYVTILVALFWLRMYKLLIEIALPQMPAMRKCSVPASSPATLRRCVRAIR
jgi:hypothetical protein